MSVGRYFGSKTFESKNSVLYIYKIINIYFKGYIPLQITRLSNNILSLILPTVIVFLFSPEIQLLERDKIIGIISMILAQWPSGQGPCLAHNRIPYQYWF